MPARATQRAEEEADALREPSAESIAQSAQRARSVPTALPLPPVEVTERDVLAVPKLVRTWLLEHARAFGAREFDLIHGPPATLGGWHARHQQAAEHWQWAPARVLRQAWGLLHTAITAGCYVLADATFSPAGALLAVLSLLVWHYWL
jgi:hypothetical protein